MSLKEIILSVHLLILAFVAWNVFHADHLGFKWMRGKINILDKKQVSTYHNRIWIGLWGMIITGLVMFLPLRDFLLHRPQFYAKMGFVLVLILNGLFIGKLQNIATTQQYARLAPKEKILLFVSGAISTLAWLGAVAGGFYLLP